MSKSEEMFVKNYLICHKEKVPKLLDWYISKSKGEHI